METKTYTIRLVGCDSDTEIDFELTADELDLLEKIAEKVNKVAGTNNCNPTMVINNITI